MKILLAALLTLPLATLAGPRAGSAPQPVDDPPPVECPFCGGNVQLHRQVMAMITTAGAESCRLALVAFWQ